MIPSYSLPTTFTSNLGNRNPHHRLVASSRKERRPSAWGKEKKTIPYAVAHCHDAYPVVRVPRNLFIVPVEPNYDYRCTDLKNVVVRADAGWRFLLDGFNQRPVVLVPGDNRSPLCGAIMDTSNSTPLLQIVLRGCPSTTPHHPFRPTGESR